MNGNWKALFITSNPLITRELTALLNRSLPHLSCTRLEGFPTPQELTATMRAQSPNLCFLDFARDPEQMLGLIPELLRLDGRLVIVAVLPSSDPSQVLRCLRQGASEFLLTPFTADQVGAALQKIARLLPDQALRKAASVCCVMPAKGGCGATTIACNLAFQWKRFGSNRVLLADLDPLAGTVSFVLKIKSQYSFSDVLHRSSDIDADLWNAMVTARNGVDVLLSPETMLGADDLTDARSIIEYARYNYDQVILDAGSVYGPWNLSQAALADEVLLVTTNELMALQAAQRGLTYLENNGVARWKIRVIVNRYERQAGLSEDVIATALNADVYHLLPSDYEVVQKAVMEGKSIPPSTALGKGLTRLADRLAGRAEPARKSSSLAGLFSLFSRTSG
jgi:pilus assembly protein CpaE